VRRVRATSRRRRALGILQQLGEGQPPVSPPPLGRRARAHPPNRTPPPRLSGPCKRIRANISRPVAIAMLTPAAHAPFLLAPCPGRARAAKVDGPTIDPGVGRPMGTYVAFSASADRGPPSDTRGGEHLESWGRGRTGGGAQDLPGRRSVPSSTTPPGPPDRRLAVVPRSRRDTRRPSVAVVRSDGSGYTVVMDCFPGLEPREALDGRPGHPDGPTGSLPSPAKRGALFLRRTATVWQAAAPHLRPPAIRRGSPDGHADCLRAGRGSLGIVAVDFGRRDPPSRTGSTCGGGPRTATRIGPTRPGCQVGVVSATATRPSRTERRGAAENENAQRSVVVAPTGPPASCKPVPQVNGACGRLRPRRAVAADRRRRRFARGDKTPHGRRTAARIAYDARLVSQQVSAAIWLI